MTTKSKSNVSPYDAVQTKLAFMRMLGPKEFVLNISFCDAAKRFPMLAAIAEKLSYEELNYLVNKINEKL